MPISLPDLPYPANSLGDVISAETFQIHHGKHHKGYVDKTNEQLPAAGLEGARLSEVIRSAKKDGDHSLFNNAAQVWNHSFFWQCLTPAPQQPTGRLLRLIKSNFGSLEAMIAKLKNECAQHFASGWGWLVLEGEALMITSLHDADTPVAHEGMRPLLTIDVWEHAYYIDYRNARADYLDAVLGTAINWEFVAANLDGAGIDRADQ